MILKYGSINRLSWLLTGFGERNEDFIQEFCSLALWEQKMYIKSVEDFVGGGKSKTLRKIRQFYHPVVSPRIRHDCEPLVRLARVSEQFESKGSMHLCLNLGYKNNDWFELPKSLNFLKLGEELTFFGTREVIAEKIVTLYGLVLDQGLIYYNYLKDCGDFENLNENREVLAILRKEMIGTSLKKLLKQSNLE